MAKEYERAKMRGNVMPELPFYENLPLPPFSKGGMGGFVDWQACRVEPLCARPADMTVTCKGRWDLLALAGSRGYCGGFHGEEFIRGRANAQSDWYWSSTTNANNTDNAWNVNMWNGNVNNDNKDNNNYVWPVRSGEWDPQKISPCPSLSKRGNTPLNRGELSPPLEKGDAGGFLFSFENLYRCYLKCRKNKRNTINALKFEMNVEENLFRLSEELQNKTYKPSRPVCFIVERPKMREIIAADFRDRVVHHLLVERLEAIYEPIFIYDSYACRIDKGIHRAVERTREFIRKGSANGNKRLYFVHLDIKNFFMTIDKNVLYGMLHKKVKDETLLWLAHTIIFHNPTENCIIKGKKSLIKSLPPHKSLFHAPANKGLPIGNLTSQFFANVYLNELDQYAKHTLKCRYYIRYCDDFLILDESTERLQELKRHIEYFADKQLKLSLNDKFDSIMPVGNGIDFLGYVVRQDYVLARRRVVNNLKAKLLWFKGRLVLEQNGVKTIKYDYGLLEKLRATVASYWGHLQWADAYNLKHSIIEKFGFMQEYFSSDNEHGLKPLYKYRQEFPLIRFQYLYYAGIFPLSVVFFQVGGFYEFYEELTDDIKSALNLRPLTKNRRSALYGLPVQLQDAYIKRLLEINKTVVVVKETGIHIGKLKERIPVMKIQKMERLV